ncbi:hypothetical protein K438DRAFT_1813526 [Mycena galopus ATCC 62051]|nr:hypothetical protein K438DRAFT_1813526 [Mycena galopus ATCC 62051]
MPRSPLWGYCKRFIAKNTGSNFKSVHQHGEYQERWGKHQDRSRSMWIIDPRKRFAKA